ncbi:uncharacterized protein LOC143286880 isoform X2 [Babylonia areolata]|uniref:uncharacterized protein LOC143286880 isoform X2 n=1 Tax=Babylonia areolata TaxID=304850 RepID=UPI003FD2177C
MDTHSFSRRTKVQGDPLLTECEEKDTMDSFSSLLSSNDRAFSDFDLDLLESNNDFGQWLHNTSLSQLTSLDTDGDASLTEGSLLQPVNPDTIMPLQHEQQTPQSIIPLQQEQQTQPLNQHQEQVPQPEMDSPNSAAMRLHANCSNMEDVKTVLVQQPAAQQTQHIQLVAMPITVSTSNTSLHSPMKTNTIILGGGGTFSVAGTTFIASPQKIDLQTVSSATASGGVQKGRNVLTPSQCSPVLLGHLQSGITPSTQRPITVAVASPLKHTNFVQHHSEPSQTVTSVQHHHKLEEKVYPKPVFSYSCLIALALKNSKTGNLPVSEIYNFMCENFPYFKTAPDGWKNSVRHNLSLNKCFAKVDNPKLNSGAKKGCLWALNPAKVKKMEEEIAKWGKKDPVLLLNSMAYPENLEAIEKGQAGLPFRKDSDSDEEENVPSPLPSTTVKKDVPSTPQKHVEEFKISEYSGSPMQPCDLEQEYVNHAIQWGLQDTDVNDLHIDLLTSSPVTTTHGSPLPHTPSRSGSLTTV